MHGHRVHVHGPMAKNEVHPPQARSIMQCNVSSPCCVASPAVARPLARSLRLRSPLLSAARSLALRVQHAPQGSINYASAAAEEMHDVAVHPPPVKLMRRGAAQLGV